MKGFKCDGPHPPKGKCAVCFAEENDTVCIEKGKRYSVCKKHLKLTED